MNLTLLTTHLNHIAPGVVCGSTFTPDHPLTVEQMIAAVEVVEVSVAGTIRATPWQVVWQEREVRS